MAHYPPIMSYHDVGLAPDYIGTHLLFIEDGHMTIGSSMDIPFAD